MSEDQNDFAGDPAEEPVPSQQEEAAPDAVAEVGPDAKPSQVAEAVKTALATQAAGKLTLAPCPCGAAETNLMLDVPQGSKVGRASCGACGTWGVDFLVPRVQDQELVGRAAAKAWNEAPRR